MTSKIQAALRDDNPGGPLWHQALDDIAGLEFEPRGMKQRLELVEAGVSAELVAALDSQDSDVRCKAANALGCLSANPEAARVVLGYSSSSLYF
jgi:hypothetical protein